MPTPQRLDKIVIVDDDARIRDLLRRFLSQEGFDVLMAEDSRALTRIMQRESVDLLVLDLMLPGEDGLAICRRLRAESLLAMPRTPSVPNSLPMAEAYSLALGELASLAGLLQTSLLALDDTSVAA